MTSEEQFFKEVKGHFEGFSPDVPGNVYTGMRRRMWWGGFMKLDATRFNAWYLLLLLGAAGAGTMAVVGSDPILAKGAENSAIELTSVMPAAPTMIVANENNSCCVIHQSCNNTSKSVVTATPGLQVVPGPETMGGDAPLLTIEDHDIKTIDPLDTPQLVAVYDQPTELEESMHHGSISGQLQNGSNNLYINTTVYRKK